MKAWILNSVGKIEYCECDKPQISENEVLVKVMVCGICGSDIPRIYRDGAHVMPLIPGHEFSGIICEAYDDKYVGKRVGIYPLIPCFECESCIKGTHEMCKSYSYLGSRRNGGFAEYVSVPKNNIIELPDTVSYEAAAMLEPMAVAVHAIRRIKIEKNDKIAVCGLGTVGLLITMFLMEMGYENIYVIGNKRFQREKALSLGISEDKYVEAKELKNVDAFFECVGKNETISLGVDIVSPGGSICMVGNPATDIELPKNVYWKILRNQINLTGTWNSSFFEKEKYEVTDWEYVINALANNRINPENFISHRFNMEEINQGFEIMRDKKCDYVKIMAVTNE